VGKTIRKEPSSGCYMRKQKHIAYRKSEEASCMELDEPSNRHKSWKTRIVEPWNDEKIISHYRGQKWDRKYKEN